MPNIHSGYYSYLILFTLVQAHSCWFW